MPNAENKRRNLSKYGGTTQFLRKVLGNLDQAKSLLMNGSVKEGIGKVDTARHNLHSVDADGYNEHSGMTWYKFITESIKTESLNLRPIKLSGLKDILTSIKEDCSDLDLMKKQIFYGKETSPELSGDESDRAYTEFDPRLFHALLGIITEAGEISELFLKAIENPDDFDIVNLKEEIGDMFWYMAIIFHSQNMDPFEVMSLNHEKLKSRFGEKFSEASALNRDLGEERKILSGTQHDLV